MDPDVKFLSTRDGQEAENGPTYEEYEEHDWSAAAKCYDLLVLRRAPLSATSGIFSLLGLKGASTSMVILRPSPY